MQGRTITLTFRWGTPTVTARPFSDRQAKYAAWRDQLKQQSEESRLDLTDGAEAAPSSADPWSTESLLAESRAIAAREARAAEEASAV